jgi:hypothetical protein
VPKHKPVLNSRWFETKISIQKDISLY